MGARYRVRAERVYLGKAGFWGFAQQSAVEPRTAGRPGSAAAGEHMASRRRQDPALGANHPGEVGADARGVSEAAFTIR